METAITALQKAIELKGQELRALRATMKEANDVYNDAKEKHDAGAKDYEQLQRDVQALRNMIR